MMWGALSDERTGLSFTIAAGPRQLSQSRVRIPWDSWSHFTVSDSRLPFSSPPTTCRATMQADSSRGTDKAENAVLLLRSADHTENKSRDSISPVHWRADCYLVTSHKHSSYCCVRASRGVYQTVTWQCVDMSQYDWR
jgi:hypothetical protein